MASSKLPNYLRAHRKRLALSQEEVAYLLGAGSGAKVCRYERFLREPGLHTILAFEAIFQKPAHELFRGPYQKIERQVAKRAATLLAKMEGHKGRQRMAHKQKALENIANPQLEIAHEA